METLKRSRTVWLILAALFAAMAAAAFAVIGSGATAPAVAAQVPRTDAAGTVWLCRPGIADNPCSTSFATNQVSANGSTSITTPAAVPGGIKGKTDCFYVYPTVSAQTTVNANLNIDPQEINVARIQASRFSADCQVWAPMYTQVPVSGLAATANFVTAQAAAYASILQGFQDYIKHYNKGRPIIFIGHSQGSAMLMELLAKQVDGNAKLRKQIVSVILAGGNFTVANGSDRGGTFKNIPTCAKLKQAGCVIAYSSWLANEAPPAGTFFGIPGQGVSFLSLSTNKDGVARRVHEPGQPQRRRRHARPVVPRQRLAVVDDVPGRVHGQVRHAERGQPAPGDAAGARPQRQAPAPVRPGGPELRPARGRRQPRARQPRFRRGRRGQHVVGGAHAEAEAEAEEAQAQAPHGLASPLTGGERM